MAEKNKKLVIVESPAKAKTIEKYLGEDYQVASSIGHIRDLPKKSLSIDIKNGFQPKYEIDPTKKKLVNELKNLANKATDVLLATDEDREGEAIAWHLANILNLDLDRTKRIVFHEITKKAITEAIQNPRKIDLNLVNAQQARRVLDRLVGYELSPVLWKKVQRGLSAGRVQSVAVRLIVEREKEIDNFIPESSFKVIGEFLNSEGKIIKAELNNRFKNFDDAFNFINNLKNSNFIVGDISVKPSKRSPSAPFTTSTLQQEASRKLGFSVKQTMTLAQKLYESGKITYMRTDSVNLSDFALDSIANQIRNTYGSEYFQKRKFINKNETAQEAHEAIRPTDVFAKTISGDKNLIKLYDLIWKRTVASQMSDAEIEKTTININIDNSEFIFVATGEFIKFDGFLKLYFEGKDDENEETEDTDILPKVNKNERLEYSKIIAKEIFKNPPPRYTEASLVKNLEELGIGRPSTYAPTISTIIERGYVVKEDRDGKERKVKLILLNNNNVEIQEKIETYGSEKSKLFPTNIGIVVNDFLVKNFSEIVDYNFTAKIEEEFDEIATGKKVWNNVIENFYAPFSNTVKKSDEIKRSEALQSIFIGNDPKSGKPIYSKIGKYGPMLQMGENEDTNEKPKFASIPKNIRYDQITLEEALKLFELPRFIGYNENGEEITSNRGRFGPYIKCGNTFVSIKEDELFTISLDEALKRINEKISAKNNNLIKEFKENSDIKILRGRYGPYITDGNINVKIPKDKMPEELSFNECIQIIEDNKSTKATKTPIKFKKTKKK